MRSPLQTELKQSKPFPRRSSEAALSILRTAALLDHQASEALKPYGITTTQYNVLRILRGAGRPGLCGREVAERLISAVPDVSRLLDRMEDLGLITRERDPADRRHVTAQISEKGLDVLEQATPGLEDLEEAWFKDIDSEALQPLIDALADIRGAGR
jgi:DNA-binding MarR family transcriptional regulator